MQYISRLSSSYCARLVLRTLVRGDYASLVFLDTHRNLLISDFMTCIRYIVVFCSRTFSCTSPISQRIISYVLGSTYLEILRDDLTNIYNNYLLCSFQRTNLPINSVLLVVAFVSLVLRNYHYVATSLNSCA